VKKRKRERQSFPLFGSSRPSVPMTVKDGVVMFDLSGAFPSNGHQSFWRVSWGDPPRKENKP
jgi:hypothetical protein